MLENNNRYKLLKVFLENPLDSFRLRELSRIVKISPPSVMAYLKEFDNEELVIKFEKRGIPFYKANRENEKFIVYKKISIIYEIYSCGIVNEIWDKLAPQAIILYGSHVKGEAIDDSDIDMFAITNNKNVKRMDNKAMDIDLKKYEVNSAEYICLYLWTAIVLGIMGNLLMGPKVVDVINDSRQNFQQFVKEALKRKFQKKRKNQSEH